MPKHKIYLNRRKNDLGLPEARKLITKSIKTVLNEEKVSVPCEINIVLTDDEEIREVNFKFRNVDKSTDVLSFPSFEFEPGNFSADVDMMDPSGNLPLGDIMISVPHILVQAKEYGHSPERELCYLAVHSALHLLGYDHIDEGKMKKQMRAREEHMMTVLGIER